MFRDDDVLAAVELALEADTVTVGSLVSSIRQNIEWTDIKSAVNYVKWALKVLADRGNDRARNLLPIAESMGKS
jgi:hypothetical protein